MSNPNPKCYNVQGDCRQLEFSVELAFLGHSSSLSALNFEDFIRNEMAKEREGGGGGGMTSHPNGDSKRIVLERRTIRWQEGIPKPSKRMEEIGQIQGEEAMEDGQGRKVEAQREEEEEEEGDEAVKAKGEEEEEEEVPEDPGSQRNLPKIGQINERRRRALSHRIFTILDDDGTEKAMARHLVEQQQQQHQQEMAQQQFVGGTGSSTRRRKRRRVIPIGHPSAASPIRLAKMPADHKAKFHTALFSAQKMRVMAFLGEEANGDWNAREEEAEMQTLWEMSLNSNGNLLTIRPDFGTHLVHSKWGIFEATMAPNELVEFDHLAQTDGEEEEEEEEEGEEHETFEMPTEEFDNEYWLHFLVEIGDAHNFPMDNVRLEWKLDIPHEGIRLIHPREGEEMPMPTMMGRTGKCQMRRRQKEGGVKDDVAHFGNLIQFTLAHHHRRPPANADFTKMAKLWPGALNFRIISEDNWGRRFINGYCTLHLPIQPGQHSLILDCWQPTDFGDKVTALRREHLGDQIEADPIWASNMCQNTMNALAIQPQPNGATLGLLVHTIHQCKFYASRHILNSWRYAPGMGRMAPHGGRMEGAGQGMHWRIAKVLEEFERARRQLLALIRAKQKQKKLRQIALH